MYFFDGFCGKFGYEFLFVLWILNLFELIFEWLWDIFSILVVFSIVGVNGNYIYVCLWICFFY